jgi:hypothetical protein
VRLGSFPACQPDRYIFRLATCYAGLNGRVRPEAAVQQQSQSN